ncbi:MAG TPA: hypothetical protein VFG52_12140 [Xanthomonadales bacterium]|nr:hypothetical protein [Xanthomonadales bacterium]
MTQGALQPDNALQQAGLQNFEHQAEDFELYLLTSTSLLRLHSLQPLQELNEALGSSNIYLPGRVNQSSGQDPSALCLAPSEWLLFSEYLVPGLLQSQLQEAIDPGRTALLDQNSAFAVLRLSGPVAPRVLEKCAGLDWRTAMGAGAHCCRTLLQQIPAIVHYHQPGSGSGPYVFDVIMERSLARHGWQVLLEKLPHARELHQRHGSR